MVVMCYLGVVCDLLELDSAETLTAWQPSWLLRDGPCLYKHHTHTHQGKGVLGAIRVVAGVHAMYTRIWASC
jgi:hypothetical protein